MTQEDWARLLKDNPRDRAMRQAYADWLEENGDSERAEGLRWMLAEGKRPRAIAGDEYGSHCWWSHDVWPDSSWDPEDLPGEVFAYLAGSDDDRNSQRHWFPSHFAAEMA